MARLTVRLHGQQIADLELHEGQEYLVGRAEECAIVLPAQKGISRHHLKVIQRDGVWAVELLARFGALMESGRQHEALELKKDLTFSAPPFEFDFKLEAASETEPAPSETAHLAPVRAPDSSTHTNSATGSEITGANNEATVAALSAGTPFLLIHSKSTGREEILKLEGQLWVAGRDRGCEIFLEDSRASRRHFEISRTPQGFFITDLNSANGTELNDEAITANEPWQLTSGDVVRVSGVKLVFEIRDLGFSSRVPALTGSVPPLLDPNSPLEAGELPAANVVRVDAAEPLNWSDPKQWHWQNFKRVDFRKHKVRVALLVLLPILIYGLLKDDTKKEVPAEQSENASTSVTFDQLSPEKKRAVKDSFELAKTMYMQGKYALCMAELGKLHQIVPAFENSTELQTFCLHGSELVKKQMDEEHKLQQQAETDRLVSLTVDDCGRNLPPAATKSQWTECLLPAIERDPNHKLVVEALEQAQMKEAERQSQIQSQMALKQQRQNAQRIFERAKAHYKDGNLAKALSEYERFLNLNHPELQSARAEAQRDVAQARKELDLKVSGLLKSCKEALEKSDYAAAYKTCDQALREDPSNDDVKRSRTKALAELHRELKSNYEDSVLEESMGNIDSAKERWKQIMEKADPSDEYFIKSKRNLQKYGVGT